VQPVVGSFYPDVLVVELIDLMPGLLGVGTVFQELELIVLSKARAFS
jgi:hypothetical protein